MNTTEIFALDIGTREIAGLILGPAENGYELKYASVHQQLPGAMADGQIHHIDAVSTIIKKIKSELEIQLGTPLNEVAVAAAGRSLLTETGISSMDLVPNQRLTDNDIRALELDAVRNAIKKLAKDNGSGVMDSYLCVGYSVVQYYLDDEPIGSLLDHQGKEARVHVISTFLPRIVINSLGTALKNAELKMASLTLEPIAAMHLVVPPSMRMLNISLVDVGAGTSDLTISAQGTVKAYGMVSCAGDSITKAIAEYFLLDLTVAEKVKVNTSKEQSFKCKDALGNALEINYDDLLKVILPHVEILATKIAQEVMALNGGAPKGIILIGGGSRTPKLDVLLAKQLDLPQNLVRMRDRSSLENIQGWPEYSGPEVITPIGIGTIHLDDRAMQLVQISVNGEQHQILKMASSTVGEALLHANIVPSELVGRPGPAYTVELNGRYVPLPGTLGEGALVKRNGVETDLSAPLEDGDLLTVVPGKPGKPPHVTLGEFTEASANMLQLTLNDESIEVEPQILVNGIKQPLDYVIKDRDKITLKTITNFQELFQHLGITAEEEFTFFLNSKPKTGPKNVKLFIDGQEQPHDTRLRPNISAEYRRENYTIGDVFNSELSKEHKIIIQVNGKHLELNPERSIPLANGKPVSFDYIIRPNDKIQYNPPTKPLNAFIVTDIFREYEPDKAFSQRGGRILVNGDEAGFTTPIKDGDVVEFLPYGVGMANS